MTPARLQEIKEAEARHWPWYISKDGDGITILASDHGDGVFLGRMRDKQSASDTVLLRNAAPEMLAEIEGLQGALAMHKQHWDKSVKEWRDASDLADRQAKRIEELEGALKQVPIVKMSADALSWCCPACGARSGITPSGADIQEDCKPGCYVAAVESALASKGGEKC